MNANQIIRIPLSGSVNMYAVKSEAGVILVDTGYPGQGQEIIIKLHRLAIKMTDIKLIIITHAHIDHYGGAYELKRILKVPVAIHESDADVLINGIDYPLKPHQLKGKFIAGIFKLKYNKAKHLFIPFRPDILIDSKTDLRQYGFNGSIVETPGETPGSISLLFEDGQAIVGDLLNRGILWERPGYPPYPQNLSDIKESLRILLGYYPEVLYTGHTKPVDVTRQLGHLMRLAQ
jgi:hydroxyacylglutathione hydrolase